MLSKTGIACLLGSLAAALGPPAAAGAVTFNPHADYPSGGTFPQTIAVGDFNGDGRPDLAIANKGGGGTITVLLNKGNGTFGAPTTYTVGGVPTGIAVGDFYGNGRLDLAIAENTNEIVILVNTGNGTFGASSTVEVPYATRLTKIVAGNFNGHEDLAATDESEERIYLALNDGKGDFTASTHLTTSGAPMGLAVGDLNDDGHEDIVAANAYMNTVGVFTGNGNGTFSAEHSYPTGEDPTSVAVANLKDGAHTYPDVVTTDSESGKVSVLLNKGNGELEEQHEYEAGADAYGLAVGAFDGDSHVDLAVANFSSGEAISVLPGKGDGTFGAPVSFKTAPGPAGVVAADFDGVAGTDLAVACEVSAGEEGAVSVLLSPFEQLTPSSYNDISLGSAWVGETGAPEGVTFTNTGNTVVTIGTAYVNGEMMIEALDTCLGATLAPGASCVVEAALRPTAAAEHLSGAIVVQWGGELADSLLIKLAGDATLGPSHSKVSASNTPERCPLDYSDCEVILDFAKSGYLSEQALIDDGIAIIYGCVATRCETTILLYGSTNLFELLSNAHGASTAFAGRAKRARRVLLGEERVTLVKGERRRVRVRLSATGRRLIRKLRSNATLELVQETKVKGKLVSDVKKIKLVHATKPARRKA